MIGHSIGEYVAACLAGVFSLEDALRLVAARGRLMDEMPAGSDAGGAAVRSARRSRFLDARHLPGGGQRAGARACSPVRPRRSTAWRRELSREATATARRLHTSHAFHSRMMDPVVSAFVERVQR